MWADAQRDGRPAEYMVAPAVQRRKVWLTPNTGVLCSRPNAVKTRNPRKKRKIEEEETTG